VSQQRFKQPPTKLDRDEFMAAFGKVYEHSPWIAEAVFEAGLDPRHDRIGDLHEAMVAAVEAAPRERQLALLRAHPDLAGRLAISGKLTADSAAEQAGVGLDKCTPDEFARFTALNDAYKAKFGFPFVMAVRGRTREEIVDAFARRLKNDAASEFHTALDEVHKIALLRLRDL
jgi:2-oxo-4-hydroxy-4-carboxy-5-ureidoimidazoline decarboxylase